MSRHKIRSIGATLAVMLAMLVPAAPATAADIQSNGPLTQVTITPDLNCAVNHAQDTLSSFFGDTACGTFVATGGQVYGPASVPANEQAMGAFAQSSQSAVTGSGSNADPFRIETVVTVPNSSLQVTQVDSYVVGEESYRTDATISNPGSTPADGVLYRAGDCQLGDDDRGYGRVDQTGQGSAVACRGGTDTTPGDRVIQFLPQTPGSQYMEGFFQDVWAAVASGNPLPNTCACDQYLDNGAGLSWTFSLPPGDSQTFSNITTFSPDGRLPLTTTKEVRGPPPHPGGAPSYQITVSNPNATDVNLDDIFDDLADGFSYNPGTSVSGGAVIADPSVNGQRLTWTGPFVVPAGGTAQLSFDATAGPNPGTYFNDAGATANGFTVSPSGPTAQVEVLPNDPPRVPGNDVTRVAINMCQFLFTQPGSARTVVVARNDVFADALAGAPLLADDSCLVVTTGGPDAPLDPDSRAEIDRVLPPNGLVRIAGGTNAVSSFVQTELENAQYLVERFAGNSRYETAALIARKVAAERPGATKIMLAAAGAFPDAVTGGAYGAYAGIGIVLSDQDTLDGQAAQVIQDLGVQEVIILGGEAAISTNVENQVPVSTSRYQGSNRMATAADVADRLWPQSLSGPATAVVVTNIERDDGWVLTLASAPLSARQEAPQVGVALDRYPTETQGYIQGAASSLQTAYIIGDSSFVSDQVAAQIKADIP